MFTLPTINKRIAAGFVTLGLATTAIADCTYQLFNLSSSKGTRISEFIDQISEECGYTVLVQDKEAEKILRKRLNKTNLQDLIISEVFDIILRENNLDYKLKNNVLKISYITTKTYNIDYIISERTGKSQTQITLSGQSSEGNEQSMTSGTSTAQSSAGESKSGLTIESTDTFQLWSSIQAELHTILNRPEDKFQAELPVLNKEAGLITVSATLKQIKRLDEYLKRLQNKLQNQVMIDVHLYSVTLSDAKATGIDWSQIFSLQNVKITSDYIKAKDVSTFEDGKMTELTQNGNWDSHLVNLSGTVTINDLVKFLQEQGDVRSISNPKILTLNNQPALISVGNQFFYKITQSSSQASAGGSTIVENDIIDSVFAGILLDITPEISEDAERVTLKINPSISETIDSVSSDATSRTLPPDLSRKQISSVVTAKNGEQVILGGLIGSTESNKVNKVPLLGDIPLLGALFRSSRYEKSTTELDIVITPHIMKKETQVSLKDLGFKGILDKEVKDGSFIETFNPELLKELKH